METPTEYICFITRGLRVPRINNDELLVLYSVCIFLLAPVQHGHGGTAHGPWCNHLTRTRPKRIHLPAGRGRRRVVITVDRLWGKTRRRRSLASLIISAVSPLFRFPLFWFWNKKAALWPSELFIASKPLYTLILSPSPLALGEKLDLFRRVCSSSFA